MVKGSGGKTGILGMIPDYMNVIFVVCIMLGMMFLVLGNMHENTQGQLSSTNPFNTTSNTDLTSAEDIAENGTGFLVILFLIAVVAVIFMAIKKFR